MDPVARQLAEQIRQVKRDSVRFRMGEITDTSPLSVALGGSDESFIGVSSIAGGLSVGDFVACLTFGSDLLVLGQVS